MAAVSIPPSPQIISTMTSRRAPLANIPNAANSPFRAVAAAATKRQRSHAGDQRELTYGQPPPAKKLIVEVDDAEARRHGLGRRTIHNPNAFQRKLEAAREAKAPSKASERPQKVNNENLESIRQWQRHYKRMFPTFVFYFDSIPEDVRSRASRQAHTLGAREEKFFSKAVTHVVTTRPIPPENDSSSSTGFSSNPAGKGAARTIDPSVLDRSAEGQAQSLKGRFTFEPPAPKPNNGDILHKAREMGMKIWSAEKLQRMLNTMFHTDTGEQVPEHPRRNAITQAKAGRDIDLQQLLQNEKVNGPADRDLTVATQEMVQIRGYYIYIHDMDEQTRPCMIREYAKPATKEEGKWPQFRVTGPGKCPFVEDPNHMKRSHVQDKHPEARNERASTAVPRTRAAAAMQEAVKGGEPVTVGEKRVLAQNNNLARRPSTTANQPGSVLNQSKPLDPPALVPTKRGNPDSMPPMFGSAQASIRAIPRFAGGEPVASGIQPSNITSAIRSQMISSTAAAPGARAGTSKEMHQLKRKVLEKNSVPSATSMPSSYMNDVRAAINDCPPPRAAKRKAQDTLTHIHEDMTVSEEEKVQQRKIAVVRRKKSTEKELKPGYCENCREKFNDFDEHIASRKHRKFALTLDNWRELDALLSQLVRR